MGFFDSIKNLTKPYDDEDDFYDEPRVSEPPPAQETKQNSYSEPPPKNPFAGAYGESRRTTTAAREEKVVNISPSAALQVVLVRPERFETAAEIADHLRSRRTIVMNLEQTQKDIARRLIDFLSGVAYAQDGKIKKVANSTYLITPYSVDLMGELIDELETSGVYF